MPQRVILHMGSHKTGTTALQQTFCDQEKRLADAGILYPHAGRTTGHHNLAKALMEGDRRTQRALCDEIREAETVLLSSELFSCLNLDELSALRRLFPGASFEVIFVLRRLPALLPSHWRELIKHGLPTSFTDYLSEFRSMKPVEMSSPLRLSRFLHDVTTVFGYESLKLLVFDTRQRGAQYGIDFARDALGLDDAAQYQTQELNHMPAPWKMELVRICHCFGIGWINHVGRTIIANGLLGELNYQVPRWIDEFKAHLDRVEPVVLTEQSPIVIDEHERLKERYHDRFIDPPDALFAPLKSEVKCLSTLALSKPLQTEIRWKIRSLRRSLIVGSVTQN